MVLGVHEIFGCLHLNGVESEKKNWFKICSQFQFLGLITNQCYFYSTFKAPPLRVPDVFCGLCNFRPMCFLLETLPLWSYQNEMHYLVPFLWTWFLQSHHHLHSGLKVVDCRICGDPRSVLRFAFVEFAVERELTAASNILFIYCFLHNLICNYKCSLHMKLNLFPQKGQEQL